MGKNKTLRKVIHGLETNISKHRIKIESELCKDHPNVEYITVWLGEIKAGEERAKRLKRRLRKES